MGCPSSGGRGGTAELTEEGPIHGRRWLSSTEKSEMSGWVVP